MVHTLLTGYASLINTCSSSCLICLDDVKIIIDTGSRKERMLLARRLRELKIKPEQIDVVLNTHLHLDHCGNNDMFANSYMYYSEAEYDMLSMFVRMVHSKGEPFEEIVNTYLCLPYGYEGVPKSLKRLIGEFLYRDRTLEKILTQRRAPESMVKTLGFQIIETPGHTDGHVSFAFSRGENDAAYIFPGDVIMNEDHYLKDHVKILFSKDVHQYHISKSRIERLQGHFYPGHGPGFMGKVPA